VVRLIATLLGALSAQAGVYHLLARRVVELLSVYHRPVSAVTFSTAATTLSSSAVDLLQEATQLQRTEDLSRMHHATRFDVLLTALMKLMPHFEQDHIIDELLPLLLSCLSEQCHPSLHVRAHQCMRIALDREYTWTQLRSVLPNYIELSLQEPIDLLRHSAASMLSWMSKLSESNSFVSLYLQKLFKAAQDQVPHRTAICMVLFRALVFVPLDALAQVQLMVEALLANEAVDHQVKLLEGLRVVVFRSSEYQRKETLVKWYLQHAARIAGELQAKF